MIKILTSISLIITVALFFKTIQMKRKVEKLEKWAIENGWFEQEGEK